MFSLLDEKNFGLAIIGNPKNSWSEIIMNLTLTNLTPEKAMEAIRRLQKRPLSRRKIPREEKGRTYRNTIPEKKEA